jgi:hypothetical protein
LEPWTDHRWSTIHTTPHELLSKDGTFGNETYLMKG